MKILDGFVIRAVGGEQYAVATGEAAKKFKGMLKLNEVAAFMFTQMQKEVTADEVVNAVMAEYDADEETVRKDLDKFVSELKSVGIVTD